MFKGLIESVLISLKIFDTATVVFLILGIVFLSFLCPFCLETVNFLKVDKLLMSNNDLIFTKTLKIREIDQGPFLLAASGHSAGAGTSPGWDVGWEQAWKGAQGPYAGRWGPGTLDSGPLGPGEESYSGRVLGAVSFSLCPEPYVRAFLGKQEVLLAKFSTGSSAGLIPTHPAWP